MEAPPSSRLQSMLQTAVQTVQWTYSLFWQLCPDQQGMLVWGEGYYNGAIKTRKTVQPMEVSSEEASLQRSQQLMELYESLSAGESNQQTRRPCASLSPEDLTELEWFYLMCVSFSFPPGVGLPGKAYAKRQHIWLTGANEVDSKVFTRAILAKSAHIQTVVCIPLLDGVVELGTTETVQEDIGFIQQVKSFFSDHHPPQPPKPAVSEQSTSNPAASSGHPRFDSPPVPLPAMYAPMDPLPIANQIDNEEDDDEEKEEEEEEEEEEDEEDQDEEDSEADSGAHQNPHDLSPGLAEAEPVAVEPSELMQVEMSEDIRVGSPDDGSNNLDWEFRVLAVSQAGNPADNQRRAESTRRWQVLQDRLNNGLQLPPPSGGPALEELAQEDTHYSQTVSTVLHHQPNRWSETSSSSMNPSYLLYSSQSSFSKWTIHSSDQHHHHTAEASSQWLLKYILFNVPFLHTKSPDQNSPKSINIADSTSRFPKPTPQDDLSANHVLAERRRREKLNERFVILRSLVPFVTKMDKASILGDTIEYVKQLRKKILDLEARAREIEIDPEISDLNLKEPREKRKLRIVEVNGGGGKATKAVDSESPPPPQAVVGVAVQVQVSIIESDALVEMQCLHREGLLLEVMVVLRDLRLEVTAVQSSLANGVFVAELRAKVKQNVSGKKPSIVEVKRAMHQIIPQN
ncbi:basic helix-loop-helix protein A-like [Camellia sinensis]|uniref:basic helix-loop-helix protein A-like n=1 Tax=Camellia sinensis TaxID=4442 RepID=UPI00103595CF|nr:basic helix-loop-helix protein A-like [Camellia sinensis]XP_028083637.1 basic helix-loop-helix protein A-like [Camellia sinensis]